MTACCLSNLAIARLQAQGVKSPEEGVSPFPLHPRFRICSVARMHIKATRNQVASALGLLAVDGVWAGQFREFGDALSLPMQIMQPPIAFDMGWSLRDKACIYLSGVSDTTQIRPEAGVC